MSIVSVPYLLRVSSDAEWLVSDPVYYIDDFHHSFPRRLNSYIIAQNHNLIRMSLLSDFISNLLRKPVTKQAEPAPAPVVPPALTTRTKPASIEEAIKRYGAIKDGKWEQETQHMAMYSIPSDIKVNWINTFTGKPLNKIYLNREVHKALDTALGNVRTAGLISELKTFDGCFVIRDVRGVPGRPSTHSYGLAIDINAATNALGAEPALSTEFVTCFTDAGFLWGGNFSRKDGMHFQWAGW